MAVSPRSVLMIRRAGVLAGSILFLKAMAVSAQETRQEVQYLGRGIFHPRHKWKRDHLQRHPNRWLSGHISLSPEPLDFRPGSVRVRNEHRKISFSFFNFLPHSVWNSSI